MPNRRTPEILNGHQKDQATALAERLYREMLIVMAEFPQLRIEDYDLPAVREQLVRPIAEYLCEDRAADHGSENWRRRLRKRPDSTSRYAKPIFVSGEPGIGKTTLLMVLDEALYRLALPERGSCRSLVVTGEISGYFAGKATLHVTPLSLFGHRTALLSARDWNNVLRHWTYDETTCRHSERAVDHFANVLSGRVVSVDEAELEGYVYFTETLAKRGVLVVLSSNLAMEHIHLAQDRFRVVTLRGPDHRTGDISKVCLPDAPHALFDLFSARESKKARLLAGAQVSTSDVGGKHLVRLYWDDLQNRPLMKDDFARFFRESRADFVLLDEVPFFSTLTVGDVNLTFLGHLSRFTNFVDAIHDCRLPLLVRGTHQAVLDSRHAGRSLEAVLLAYDDRVGGNNGQAAWIEWTRCLSRLRSREELNAQVWQAATQEVLPTSATRY